MSKIKSFEVFVDEQQAIVIYDNGFEELVTAKNELMTCYRCYFNKNIASRLNANVLLGYCLLETKFAMDYRCCSKQYRQDGLEIIWCSE